MIIKGNWTQIKNNISRRNEKIALCRSDKIPLRQQWLEKSVLIEK